MHFLLINHAISWKSRSNCNSTANKDLPSKRIGYESRLKRGKRDRSADIIVFLDADIRNLTPEWVDKLVKALIDDNCDMSRGFYTRHARDAAVTKLVARPMLHTFFPELSHFEQPLSGEVCARRKVWENLLKRDNGSGSTPDGWGIDVWFLIEAALSGTTLKRYLWALRNTHLLKIIEKMFPN
jgi:hypothetical protein